MVKWSEKTFDAHEPSWVRLLLASMRVIKVPVTFRGEGVGAILVAKNCGLAAVDVYGSGVVDFLAKREGKHQES